MNGRMRPRGRLLNAEGCAFVALVTFVVVIAGSLLAAFAVALHPEWFL